jgi:hypothetical protein
MAVDIKELDLHPVAEALLWAMFPIDEAHTFPRHEILEALIAVMTMIPSGTFYRAGADVVRVARALDVAGREADAVAIATALRRAMRLVLARGGRVAELIDERSHAQLRCFRGDRTGA